MEDPAAPSECQARSTADLTHQVDTHPHDTAAAMLALLAEENLPILMRRQAS
jgi:hypothetical protein